MNNKRKIKIALGQFTSVQGDTKANLEKMMKMTDEAAAQGADLVIFPELAYTGYFCDSFTLQSLAENQSGALAKTLCKKAKEKHVHIIAGYPESDTVVGRMYNSIMMVSDDGEVIGNMRKVYVWGDEKLKFAFGDKFPVVKTKLGNIGLLVCADVEYLEPARIEALKGADLIVDCSVWSINPAEHRWHVDLQAAALYNLLFVAGCNTVQDNICGSSMIVGPDGEIRAIASRTEEDLVIHEIDLDEILNIRSRIPYMNDLRMDTINLDALDRY